MNAALVLIVSIVALFASIRHQGQSIGEVIEDTMGSMGFGTTFLDTEM